VLNLPGTDVRTYLDGLKARASSGACAAQTVPMIVGEGSGGLTATPSTVS
jgi:hypothetical protein